MELPHQSPKYISLMLNRITGWLIFSQLAYVSAFAVFCIINTVFQGAIFRWVAVMRDTIGIPNTLISLTEYVSYPMAFSSILNSALALLFFWNLLRKHPDIDTSKDFFCLINSVYVVASCWIYATFLFSAVR